VAALKQQLLALEHNIQLQKSHPDLPLPRLQQPPQQQGQQLLSPHQGSPGASLPLHHVLQQDLAQEGNARNQQQQEQVRNMCTNWQYRQHGHCINQQQQQQEEEEAKKREGLDQHQTLNGQRQQQHHQQAVPAKEVPPQAPQTLSQQQAGPYNPPPGSQHPFPHPQQLSVAQLLDPSQVVQQHLNAHVQKHKLPCHPSSHSESQDQQHLMQSVTPQLLSAPSQQQEEGRMEQVARRQWPNPASPEAAAAASVPAVAAAAAAVPAAAVPSALGELMELAQQQYNNCLEVEQQLRQLQQVQEQPQGQLAEEGGKGTWSWAL
jgi:hypothetical protein